METRDPRRDIVEVIDCLVISETVSGTREGTVRGF
jgi:hypothetical protein